MDNVQQRRMREMNREAQRNRLDWSLIAPRREAIAPLLPRIESARDDAEIIPQAQTLVARVERMPFGPGCPKSMALSTALEETKSLLHFAAITQLAILPKAENSSQN